MKAGNADAATQLAGWEKLLAEIGRQLEWQGCARSFEQTPRLSWNHKTAQRNDAVRDRLTRREREVYDWITTGKTCAETAEILGIGCRTVEKHLQRIYTKTGTHRRTDLFWEAGPCH